MVGVNKAADQKAIKVIGNYVAGQHCKASGSAGHEVFNPASGEVCAHVTYSTVDDVNQAVAQALKAFETWSEVPPIIRARKMNRLLTLMQDNKEALATAITKEHGKVFSDAMGEVERGIDIVEFACGIPSFLKVTFLTRCPLTWIIGPCASL
jgi:malonate-semialdehyde dehydrogenase (acetylating)/methylmalonate-semialdehyde dehydrogenase